MPDPAIYTVGLITAITAEFSAACAMLDSEEEEGPDYVSPGDMNSYTLGTMGKHNVVIASLPHGDYGTSSAAAVASNMMTSFPNIRIGLMVGIGGGAPTAKHDIRLGDIVVSARDGDSSIGSVFQYDFGKAIQGQDFKTTRLLNQPPPALLTALSNLRQFYDRKGGHTLENDVESAFVGSPGIRDTHSRPDPTTDRLYKSEYVHNSSCCADSGGDNDPNLVARVARKEGDGKSVIHYGVIASANQLMKDAKMRDNIAEKHGVLCFEMEAAGLMNHFPCLVVRGICDYSDSHKNKQWQGYAAIMAAAYTKCLLKRIAPTRIEQERKLSEIVTNVEGSVKVMHSTTQEIHAAINDAHVEHRDDRIHNWLSHPDLNPSINYNKARQERIKGSASGWWFLQNETFSRWISQKNSSLWLYGIAGCGKTVLVSTVLEHLQRTYENVLYFYFDFAQEKKQSVDGMIRWLITQLSWRSKSSRKHIESLYQAHQQGKAQPDLVSLCDTFRAMLKDSGEVWIVLDALDECKTRQDPDAYPRGGLLSWIQSAVHSETANLHLIFTSRPEQDIKSALDRWMLKEDMYPIESGSINEDIQDYIHAKIREHKGLERWRGRPDVQEEIEEALLAKANGMFRWVSCQIQSLEQCLDLSTLRDTLKALPTTLDGTYARILNDLPETTKHITIRILQFLTYSERPLRMEEALDMAVVRTDPEKEASWFNEESRLPSPAEITRYCSSLVKVTTESIPRIGYTTEFQLAHFSVKEYLVSNRLDPTIYNDFQEMIARAHITEVCLAYLLAIPDDMPAHEIIKCYPFAGFSAQFWTTHAAYIEHRSESVLFFVRELFMRVDSYEMCGRLYDPGRRMVYRGWDFAIVPPLYYAVLNRLPRSVQMLLDKGADANGNGEWFYNPLTCAIKQGHEDIVRMLLDFGANINLRSTDRYDSFDIRSSTKLNTLQFALAHSFTNITRLCVNAGADVNDNCETGEFPLKIAASYASEEDVQILIEAGADVKPQGGIVLLIAAQKGWKNAVRLLVCAGAEMDRMLHSPLSPYPATALYYASEKGYEDIVRVLVQACADVNRSEGHHRSALAVASVMGHERVVRVFFEKGASEVLDSVKFQALCAASKSGNKGVAIILLNNGAPTDLHGGHDHPLYLASLEGHHDIVELLLDHGAYIDAHSQATGPALEGASRCGKEDIVRLLLKRGADVDAKSGVALYSAAREGNEEIVRILLNHGARINLMTATGHTPLIGACEGGHTRIVDILLRYGADPDIVNQYGHTAFSIAYTRCFGDICRVLLSVSAE